MKKRQRKKLALGEFIPMEAVLECSSPEGTAQGEMENIFDNLVIDFERRGLDCLGRITPSGFTLNISWGGKQSIDVRRLEMIRDITGKRLPDSSVKISMNAT